MLKWWNCVVISDKSEKDSKINKSKLFIATRSNFSHFQWKLWTFVDLWDKEFLLIFETRVLILSWEAWSHDLITWWSHESLKSHDLCFESGFGDCPELLAFYRNLWCPRYFLFNTEGQFCSRQLEVCSNSAYGLPSPVTMVLQANNNITMLCYSEQCVQNDF